MMRAVLAVLLSAGVLLAGCAVQHREPVTANPKAQTVAIEGEKITVAPYSDGTWGATDSQGLPVLPRNPAQTKALLVRATERVSGCKVIESEYLKQWSNLIAVVDCKR